MHSKKVPLSSFSLEYLSLHTQDSLKPWAEDLGYDGPPFPFDPDHRALLRGNLMLITPIFMAETVMSCATSWIQLM